MKKYKKISIIILVLIILFIIPAIILGIISKNASKNQKENALSWSTYQSPKFGYKVKHPKGWLIDDQQKISPVDAAIIEPGKNVIVFMNALYDPRLQEKDGFNLVINDIQQEYKNAPNYKLDYFTPAKEERLAAFETQGTFTERNEDWYFKERAVMSESGAIYNIRGNIRIETKDKYAKTLNQIIESFDPFKGD